MHNIKRSGIPLRFKYFRMNFLLNSFCRKSFHLGNGFLAIWGCIYRHILKSSTLFRSQSLCSCAFFEQKYNLHSIRQKTREYRRIDYTHLSDKVCDCIYNRLPKDKFQSMQFGFRLDILKHNQKTPATNNSSERFRRYPTQ